VLAAAILSLFASIAAASSVRAQSIDSTFVEGTVRSASGRALENVQVYIDGMNIGTLTKSDGRYEMRIPAPHVRGQRVSLRAKSIGWFIHADTIALVPGITQHDFVLDSNPVQLHEVVIVSAPPETTKPKKPGRTDSIAIAHGRPLPACLPEDDDGGLILSMIRTTVSSSTPFGAARRSYMKLPYVDIAHVEREVTQVARGAFCARAQRAYYSILGPSDSARAGPLDRIRVFKVRDLIVITDPSMPAGEWTVLLTFDRDWKYIASVLR
jgi:hypothetical protein